MRPFGWTIALALFAALLMPHTAALADTSKDCQNRNDIKVCLTLFGVGGDLEQVKASILNVTDPPVDFCGQLYVSKNEFTDWRDIPECVTPGDKVVVIWDVSGHAPFDDGTVFCSQFVTDEGVLGGQPCVVTPIPPPPRSVDNTNKCAPLNGLKQCELIAGFVVHVDYVKGTEFGIPTGSICGYEHRYEEGTDVAKGRLCVPKGAGSSSFVKWNVNRNYQQGTTICTRFRTDHGTWSGRPCGDIG